MFYTETGDIDIKKIVRLIILVVCVAIVAVIIWLVASRGGLRVTTASKDAVISAISESPGKEETTLSPGGIAVLPIGSYVVTVSEGKKQIRTSVDVTRFSIKTVSLTPPETSSTEPVTNITVASFAASQNSLSVYDSEKDQLVFVDANNTVKKTDLSMRFTTAVWQSPGNGYAVAHPENERKNRQFMKVSNGVATRFDTPTPFTQQTYLAFTVDDTNLYVLQDGTLYKRFSTVYETITKVSKDAVFLSANDTYITLLTESSKDKCELQIVTTSSKESKTIPVACVHSPDYRQGATWSPDNVLLAATTGSSLVVYDKDLKAKTTIPDTAASNPVWVSSSSLVYVSGSNLWKYDTDTDTSSVIGALPQYVTLLDLRFMPESNTFYFTGRSGNTMSLYRTVDSSKDTITAQKINESNMHQLSNYCRIRFVNMSRLVISASTPPNERPVCEADIKNYFDSIQVPQPSVQFDSTEFNFPTD